VSEARAILPEVLDRVERGEEITITRHGRPVAVLLRPDAVRSRRAEQVIGRAREVAELVATARARSLPEAVVSAERAREWVEAVRADRDR
jgi:antitoxin (DNA-binding transcriptional repressor) of toxin-antitoxin stability system